MIKATISGTLTDIFPVEHIASFKKRVFWIEEVAKETDDLRTWKAQNYTLEVWNNEVDLITKFLNQKEVLNFHIEIRGKIWEKNGRMGVINTLRCIGITKPEGAKKVAQNSPF
jgi:hypothetical protein